MKSLEEIREYENPKERKLIYFGNDPKNLKEYEKFIDEEERTIFGWVKDEKLMKSYGNIWNFENNLPFMYFMHERKNFIKWNYSKFGNTCI